MRPEPPDLRLDARGLTFDVYAGGPAGGEPVLLLHGFPQHSAEWSGVAPRLHAAGLRTYALDQRGYSPGARPEAVEAYASVELVADIVAVLDGLDLPTAHLVGHDWGALVAWQVAARHPDRVRTLTAVSVPHPGAMVRALSTDPGQKVRSSYISLFRRPGKAESVLLALDAAALRRMLAGVGRDRVETYARPMRDRAALTAALNWYRAMSTRDFAGTGPVPVPSTYVWSDGDVAIGRTAAMACAGYVTGDYRLVELPGVSHWIPDEAPEPLAAAILARVGAA
ncbi:alpha/beta fold hydrolase [Plantactinospora siamensis]|uniref:Alpha/beta fold hydrolase n=1 Tax=Plantactinospora siamensis TaxID=555372 RepID=A0ABV6NW45_9ACTN